MKLWQALALLLGLLAGPASAQTGVASGMTVTATNGTTARTLADLNSQFQDVRNFFQGTAASCGTDVSAAVAAAVTAGVTRLLLPANCTYLTTATPAGMEIIGEDWNTSIISVPTRASQTLQIGAKGTLDHVGIIGQFCDVSVNPVNTAKVCPLGRAQNVADTAASLTNWAYEGLIFNSGPSVTGPTGAVSTDTPNIASIATGTGTDSIYTQTGAAGSGGSTASGLRVVTAGSGDTGIFLLNGFGVSPSSTQHTGFWAEEFSNVSTNNRATFRLQRYGDGTNVTQSFLIDDLSSVGATNTTAFFNITAANQSSGNLFSEFQETTPFSGDGLVMNFGNNSGTFTGNFEDFQIAGSSVWKVTSAGALTTGGAITLNASTNAKISGASATEIDMTNNAGGGIAKFTQGSSSGGTLAYATFQGGGGTTYKMFGDGASTNVTISGEAAAGGTLTLGQSGDTTTTGGPLTTGGAVITGGALTLNNSANAKMTGISATEIDVTNNAGGGIIKLVQGSSSSGTLAYATLQGGGGSKFQIFGGGNTTNLQLSGESGAGGIVTLGQAGDSTVLSGTLTAAALSTSGTIAGSICATSTGLILYESGASSCTISLRHIKTDISLLSQDRAFHDVMNLKPVAFRFKAGNTKKQEGFVAEDVNAVNPTLSTYDGKGKLQGYEPNAIIAELVSVVQAQERRIEALEHRVH